METKADPGPSGPLSVDQALGAEYGLLRRPWEAPGPAASADAEAGANPAKASAAAMVGAPDERKLAELYETLHGLKVPRTAFCISGGGIRSATFGLGLIQGMARHQLLDGFDYLSTVSGGGYIGSWLTAWIHRHKGGLPGVMDDLNRVPVAPSKGSNPSDVGVGDSLPARKIDPEPPALQHLRAYSNYLSPRLGLFTADAWSIIAIYLRNLLLNWLVLIPFLAATLALPRLALAALAWHFSPAAMTALAGGALAVACVGAVRMMSYTDTHRPSVESDLKKKKSGEAAQAPAPCAGEGGGEPVQKSDNDFPHFRRGALAPLLVAAAAATAFGAWAPRSEFFAELGKSLWGPGGLAIPFGVVGVVLMLVGWLVTARQWRHSKTVFEGGSLVAVGFVGGALLWMSYDLLAGVGSRRWMPGALLEQHGMRHALYTCLAGPALLWLLFTFSNVLVGVVSGFTDEVDREWWARAAAWVLLAAVCWSLGSALVIFGPYALLLAAAKMPKLLATVGGVTGLVTVLVGKSGATGASRKGAKPGKKSAVAEIATLLAAPVFATLLIILIALGTAALLAPHAFVSMAGSYAAAFRWQGGLEAWRPDLYCDAVAGTPFSKIIVLAAVALAVSFGMSIFVNVNKFSMHAMYRNRLTRAYLGASRVRCPNLFSDFQEEDNVVMEKLREVPETGGVHRPFHVLNLTLNVTHGNRLAWQERKATSFTVSPLHGGNLRLGYRLVDEYSSLSNPHQKWLAGEASRSSGFAKAWNFFKGWGERASRTPMFVKARSFGAERLPFKKIAPVEAEEADQGQGLTLGTAMTISGAAVSPNMGYHSSRLVAFLLTFFNVRLGWWLGNPGPAGNDTYRSTSPFSSLRTLLDELMGRSTDTDRYVTLSDGGQFENLGLYEMVLRRCRLIVLSDAGEDPAYSFEDLSNALTKIHTDLGVPIEFTDQVPISRYKSKGAENPVVGSKDQLGGKYCALAIIRYSAIDKVGEGEAAKPAPDGVLVYLKPTLIGREPADLLHYARSNRAFPHEPTVDEFYSESQFESYRVLGAHIIDYLCGQGGRTGQGQPAGGSSGTGGTGQPVEPVKPAPPVNVDRPEVQARLSFERLLAFADNARNHAYTYSDDPAAERTGRQLKAALEAMKPVV